MTNKSTKHILAKIVNTGYRSISEERSVNTKYRHQILVAKKVFLGNEVLTPVLTPNVNSQGNISRK